MRAFLWMLSTAMIASITLVACSASDNAHTYISGALSLIEARALRSGLVNWSAVKPNCMKMIVGAKTPRDTYDAICYALTALNDHHSVLLTPDGVPYGPKRPAEPTLIPRASVPPRIIELKRHRVGVIFVSSWGCASSDTRSDKFAKSIRSAISEFREKHVDGWIVDLRGNTGGNMWPMLVGIGPLLGKGQHGFFHYKSVSIPWFYEGGNAGVDAKNGRSVNFAVHDNVTDSLQLEPVAVLLDHSTASSGEALAISFKGRKDTRFFGQRTYGLSTSNENIRLEDGATLLLTTSADADRTRTDYPNGVDVDEEVYQTQIPTDSANDLVLQAALRWITTIGVSH